MPLSVINLNLTMVVLLRNASTAKLATFISRTVFSTSVQPCALRFHGVDCARDERHDPERFGNFDRRDFRLVLGEANDAAASDDAGRFALAFWSYCRNAGG